MQALPGTLEILAQASRFCLTQFVLKNTIQFVYPALNISLTTVPINHFLLCEPCFLRKGDVATMKSYQRIEEDTSGVFAPAEDYSLRS
ncbi:MAG TPA: hypothetical protein PKE07_05255 [Lacibacter sp.]|nr:hypothetical protein [Lacibacter sp.]HMO88935.1 hypothetical protein [Lacibacter sp.]